MDISRPIIEKPRFIKVEQFIESRANSIAQLLKAIDNDSLVAGEVTKGPRTAAQRLPRHMRRRAMAYEVRRFPKGMRQFAASHIISNHRKKPPSRFARRKPSNILQSYIRRQMKNGKWLETHIWHAKRFRMIKKWGFKLADRSYQRGYRSIIRDSNKNCVIRDKSFLSCITISNKDSKIIEVVMDQLCNNNCGTKFSSKIIKSGKYEATVQLFNQLKNEYIGPARFQWVNSKDCSKLVIWIHPSTNETFLNEISKIWNLERTTEGVDEDEGIVIYKGNDNTIVNVFSSTFNRFRLYGPSSVEKLAGAIRSVNSEENQKYDENWKKIVSSKTGKVADGYIVSLLIEDPRICWARKKVRKLIKTENELNLSELEQPSTLFWDITVRKESRSKRMSNAEFEKRNAELIEGVLETESKIPIQIIFRESNESVLDGIEVLVPQTFGKDMWISLQRQGVKASGLRDDEAGHLEARSLLFPNNDIDSKAAKENEQSMKEELEKKYNSRPHNRRCNFWSALSIKYPFDFHWDELISNWNNENGKIKKENIKATVCRNSLQLAQFEQILKNKKNGDINEELKNCLIPVRLDFIGRGRPKKFGIICLPEEEDLKIIRKNKTKEIVQVSRICSKEHKDEIKEQITKKELKLTGFVSLDVSSREKPISLKSLFELSRNMDDKSVKKRKINKKKREAKKRRKIEYEKRIEQINKEEMEKKEIEYRFSANRKIIGRTVAGEQSLLSGHGVALGYICASTIAQISGNFNKKSMVLVRNSTSKYYHPAIVSIIRKQVQI